MDEAQREAVARLRWQMIAPLVARRLGPGEQRALLEKQAREVFLDEEERPHRVSVRTLERYLAAYRREGLEGLKPIPRPEPRGKLPAEWVEAAIALRREEPSRSVEQIIAMLELSGRVPPGVLRRTTLGRYLRRAGLSRAQAVRQKARRRYQASRVHEVWQSDVWDASIYLTDPQHPERRRQARLIAILDDRSRYVVGARFYFRENLPALEDCLRRAIARFGTPEILYSDNGSIYRSRHMQDVAARLGFEWRFSTPYQPQGKGKIERFFRRVQSQFEPEARQLVHEGKLSTLEELNQLFEAWLELGYHQKIHATTKRRPAQAVEETSGPLRLVDPLRLHEAFLWTAQARVDATGVVHLQGQLFEVETALIGQSVSLRYNPFDLSEVQVWHEGRRYADARPLELRRHTPKSQAPVEEAGQLSTGLNYLSLLERAWQEERRRRLGSLSFQSLTASPGGEGR